ncbi:TonB-dependent receptor [Dasania marina]|uniref:TonB-dependent receptor n=1 Tax=Dasania marina TaxID=471499 RepID=UPI0004B76E4D|nr:TonB-dependent receptor [Dasania marina]
MNRTMRKSLYGLSFPLLISGVVQASLLEEVVVSSQKRDQTLQDVGMSVTAFTGDQLKELGLTNSADLQNMTPGLVVMELGAASPVSIFSLRGVSQNDFGDHHEAPNAVYVDDVYVSNMAAVGAQMFDVERVEVLRGPQGTIFGRNATGGLIHIISKKPTEQFEAYTDLTLADNKQVKFEGAISGPLTDNLAARLAVATNHHDPYMKNNGSADDGAESASTNMRLQFDYSGDNLSVGLNLRHLVIDDVSGGVYDSETALTNANGEVIAEPLLADYQAFCGANYGTTPAAGKNCLETSMSNDPYKVATNADAGLDRTHDGISLKVIKYFDDVSFTSITDYQDINKDYLEDSDSTTFTAGHFRQDQDTEQFSQEFQIQGDSDKLEWTAGLYYLKIDGEYRTGFDAPYVYGYSTDNTFALETESYAAFGQVERVLSDTLTATVGLRWTHDKKEIEFNTSCTDDPSAYFFLGCDFFFGPDSVQATGFDKNSVGDLATLEDDDYSYKLQLDWRPTDDVLMYGTISRGNKAGGYSASSFATLSADQFSYDPEVLTNYEVGVKYTLSETTRLNTSVFYYDYKDYQAFTFENIATVLINLDAVVTGMDIELISNPAEGWDVLLGASILDATAKDVPLPSGEMKDQNMGLAPDLTLNAMVRKAWQAFDGEMSVQIDGNYVDERDLSTINHPGQVMDSYVVGNLRAGYSSGDGSWSMALFVNNFTDEEIEQYRFDETFVSGTILRGVAPPRWVGISGSYYWQ